MARDLQSRCKSIRRFDVAGHSRGVKILLSTVRTGAYRSDPNSSINFWKAEKILYFVILILALYLSVPGSNDNFPELSAKNISAHLKSREKFFTPQWTTRIE